MKVVTITANGEVAVVEERLALRQMQAIVGGWLEAVYGAHDEYGRPHVTIFINEEGKLKNLPINRKATSLWYAIDPQVVGLDTLRGTVIVAGGADEEGELLPIPDEIASMLLELG